MQLNSVPPTSITPATTQLAGQQKEREGILKKYTNEIYT